MAGLSDIVVPTTDGQTVIFKPGKIKKEWTVDMKLSPESLRLIVNYTSHILPGPEDCCGA